MEEETELDMEGKRDVEENGGGEIIDREEAIEPAEPESYAVMSVKASILTNEVTGKKYLQLDPGVGLKPLFDAVEKGELTQEEYWEIDDAVRRLTEQIARISELSRRRAKRL